MVWIKGIYDVSHEEYSFLITCSARLDVCRRGGDSLIGRYHHWRLHPFTLDEIPNGISAKDAFKRLMTVGGFPVQFLDGNERNVCRWWRERFGRVLRKDVRDLEQIRNIQLLGMFWICFDIALVGLLQYPTWLPTCRFLLKPQSPVLRFWKECILYLAFAPIRNYCQERY